MDEHKPGYICGVTVHTERFVFTCVRPPHAQIYYRKYNKDGVRRGQIIFDNNPQADRHHFRNLNPV